MREVKGNWVAYFAKSEGLKDAVFLGSIRMTAVRGYPERKQDFMDMMRDIVSDIIEAETGVRPLWGGEENAPESERIMT
jgi:hypothetical protein